ncbi:MAG: phosphonopyruvate decarboxylase [Clostridia bacterium]
MRTTDFLQGVQTLGISFYTGVPDSLLKPLNDTLFAQFDAIDKHSAAKAPTRHIVAANEGGAVALAAGHYIATGKPALCYLQNSGIGNAVNPIASLLDERVYGIPCVFVVGWRGEPGVKDEPQHAFQGVITRELLELLGLTVFELNALTDEAAFCAMLDACKPLLAQGRSVVFLVHKGGLTGAPEVSYPSPGALSREDALRELLLASGERDLFVATTGKTSREVFELREALHQDHAHDFLTVGSMGHASMIALGIARERPEFTVWCLDGDGAALMHMGSLAVEARQGTDNLIHILLNNGAHESVGGMPVAGGGLCFAPVAEALGFQCHTVRSAQALRTLIASLREGKGPRMVEIMLRQGSRAELGRPTQQPKENLHDLMRTIGSVQQNTEALPQK